MLGALAPAASRVILTAAANPRAADPEALRALLPSGVATVRTARSVEEALAMGSEGGSTPILCVAGSLFLVGEALRHLAGGDKPCPVEKGADSIVSLF